MSLELIIVAIVISTVSGFPGLFLSRTSVWGERISVAFMTIAAILGLTGAFSGFNPAPLASFLFLWPSAGNGVIGLDALSAFFLIPIFLMGGLGSIYGLGYWSQREHPRNGRKLRLFWGLLVAGMGVIVISRHAMSFLFGWEMMAFSAFFLVSTEDELPQCREAGWLYLFATHISTLSLFAMFALWRWSTGSYWLLPVADNILSLGMMNLLFFMALFVFGLKAGMMPLHFWLPSAHANAPSHVSAMLSGVVLKMGIYGMLRFFSLFSNPPAAWGGVILFLGMVSGLLGVVFAIGQHDLKRLLAYHSVENIGIILMGLGLAMLGRSTGRPEWVVLGMAACLLHVWNHCLFKGLLFLCAGSVIHGAETREIDRLGGLAKHMPWTAAMFVVGAVAICGLPPLNGFVSELFIYLGIFRSMTDAGLGMTDAGLGSTAVTGAPVLVVPVLAMIGALAVACFVKVYGMVFLGTARTEAAAHTHESPLTMRAPMMILVAGCAVIGLAPDLVSPFLSRATATWISPLQLEPDHPAIALSLGALVPFKAISVMSVSLIAAIVTLALALRTSSLRKNLTWDCGYALPTARMQYTASSFAQMIVSMFGSVLRPSEHRPRIEGLFPSSSKMHSHVNELVLDRVLLPAGRNIRHRFGWFHRFQQGLTQHYVLYILITLIAMLSTLIPLREFLSRVFAR